MTYEEVNSYFNNLKPFVPVPVKPGELLFDLETVKKLAGKMDDPQDKIPCVHITGTNGKGSTAAFLASVLKSAGYKTGTFSSPYLVERREQIQINSEDIPEEDFALVAGDVIEKARLLPADTEASEFEIITVAAFEYFAREKCDIAVIEVGMGGEYDATNIIKDPVLAVFTKISSDHTQVLGDSLQEIAKIKSGIIKNKTDVLMADNDEAVMKIISDKCLASGGRFSIATLPQIIKSTLSGTEFEYPFEGRSTTLKLNTPGSYQAFNAGVAVSAAEILKAKGYKISEDAVRKGLAEVKRPARFEVLMEHPVFIADGSHNPGAVEAFARSLKELFPDRKFIFITGVLADKDFGEMYNPLLGMEKIIYTITPDNPRALPADRLAVVLRQRGAFAEAVGSVENAVSKALSAAGQEDIRVAFGSLYYMGDLREIVRTHK